MLLNKVIEKINKLISNSSSYKLNFDQIEFYIDGSIDYLNQKLITDFVTPTELYDNNIEYYCGKVYLDTITTNTYKGEVETLTDITVPTTDDLSSGYSHTYFVKDITSFYMYYNNSGTIETIKYNGGTRYNITTSTNTSDVYVVYSDLKSFNSAKGFDYDIIPEDIIRQVVIYKASALYLEEEDEFETQYQMYSNRVDEYISYLLKKYSSSYKTKW